MATPRVTTRLPIYDPSKSNLAYGDRALPKLVSILDQRQKFAIIARALISMLPCSNYHARLRQFYYTFYQNRELQSSELAVRQQALLLLADVMHKRENLASALREGIIFKDSIIKKYTFAIMLQLQLLGLS